MTKTYEDLVRANQDERFTGDEVADALEMKMLGHPSEEIVEALVSDTVRAFMKEIRGQLEDALEEDEEPLAFSPKSVSAMMRRLRRLCGEPKTQIENLPPEEFGTPNRRPFTRRGVGRAGRQLSFRNQVG